MAGRPSVRKRLVDILLDYGPVDNAEEITDQSNFIHDLGFDSLDIIEIIMAVEEEFDIEIPDADAEALHTFGDGVDYVCKTLKVAT